ncbi:TPA: branched chain amino acid aminotransferase [Candidatus Peregrinibacteria bacterium]|nr:branched chain amino acid aminotransferase [Candidatus Peregrinibacteria bacterium]
MLTTPYIWKNGKFVKWAKAQTHVLTHTLHYGAGVFEGIRFYETKKGIAIFRLKEHVERLFYSAEAIDMQIPYTKQEIQKAIIATVKKNKLKSGYIRPLSYYGYGKMSILAKNLPVDTIIAVWGWGAYLGTKPIKIKISPFTRINSKSTIITAKIVGHYFNSILASLDAHKSGYNEALLLDNDGYVAEGPGENIFMIKNAVIYTPSLGSILPGITRNSIIKLARDLGYKVAEGKITPTELKKADEAFFTGTAAEISPICAINKSKMKFEKGPITMRLKEKFMKIVHGENKKYGNWLTIIR